MSGKVQYRKLTSRQRNALKKELFSTLRKLSISDDSALLLYDLLTRSEVIMLARRISIARELLHGHTLEYIRSKLHAGFDTIRAVNIWLEERFPDYHKTISPLLEERKKKKTKRINFTRKISPMKRRLLLAILNLR